MFSAHSAAVDRGLLAPGRAGFRMIDAMRSPDRNPARWPILAPDRGGMFDLRGPRKLLGDAFPAVAQTLPAPPQHEWLEAVKY